MMKRGEVGYVECKNNIKRICNGLSKYYSNPFFRCCVYQYTIILPKVYSCQKRDDNKYDSFHIIVLLMGVRYLLMIFIDGKCILILANI